MSESEYISHPVKQVEPNLLLNQTEKRCNLADVGSYRVGMGTRIGRDNLSFYLLKCFILKGECGTTHNALAGRSAWQDLEYSHWCFRCIGCWHWSLQPLSLLAQGCYNASSLQMHQLKVPIRYQCSTPYSTSTSCRIIFVRARCVFCSLRNLKRPPVWFWLLSCNDKGQ